MLLIISLAAGSFTFAGQRGLTHAPAAVKMMSSSDRHTFDDPRQILNNFFHPGSNSKSAHVYSGLKDGSTGIDTRLAAPQADDAKDLVQDSCIDWGALSPKEVAAAFIMLKGGRRADAKALLLSVLEEVENMKDAEWDSEAEPSSAFFQLLEEGMPVKKTHQPYYTGL